MTKIVSIGDEGELLCPMCGGSNLHHGALRHFTRDREGGPSFVGGYGAMPENTSNPSARREGVVIHFFCETCPAAPMLCLAQHKGATLIYWGNCDPT